jgi:hypothetical protein
MKRNYKYLGRNQWVGDQNNDTMNQRSKKFVLWKDKQDQQIFIQINQKKKGEDSS